MVVGIIIGASIFVQPSEVSRHVSTIPAMFGVWAAMLVAALIGCATLCGELVFAVDLLGRRIDRFDVSQEMPR